MAEKVVFCCGMCYTNNILVGYGFVSAMRLKLLLVLLVILCVLSCTACGMLDMASKSTAQSNANMALAVVLLMDTTIGESDIFFLSCGDTGVEYAFVYRNSKMQEYKGDLPVVDGNDKVFTNPDQSLLHYDISNAGYVGVDEDIVRNMVVIVPID